MVDKETFIKRETEVEERKILDWCGTLFKVMVGAGIALTPLTMFYFICIRNFGREPAIICMVLVSLLLVLAVVLSLIFELSNKIAYRKACKKWEKEQKVQEKHQKDEDRTIENIKFLMLFDTLKKKEVDIYLLKESENIEDYNMFVHIERKLAKEEYDLAKEILG